MDRTDSSRGDSERDPVEKLAEEFVERHRRGDSPDISEYTERYPSLAAEIRDLFPALLMVERLGEREQAPQSSVPNGSLEEPSSRLGEYTILRKIGSGGMGKVYEARQESLGRLVALKVLHCQPILSPIQLERFQREAQAAARLHHTNIVPIHAVGEADGIHYYAMQLIRGQSLDKVIEELRRLRDAESADADNESGGEREAGGSIAEQLWSGEFEWEPETAANSSSSEDQDVQFAATREGTTPPVNPRASSDSSSASLLESGSGLGCGPSASYYQRVAELCKHVSDALAYAHGEGVLHRDIKPSNLLLDARGVVWITDFGLAKAEGSGSLTQTGDMVGTLAYMAPERLDGCSDPRSDVYGLGLTLYELLTLNRAFNAPDRHQLIRQVVEQEPTAPRSSDPRIPRDLETIVLKAIEKEPTRRYETAERMRDYLRCFVEGKPISVRRSSTTERLWLWCRRKPAMASLCVVAAVLLVAVGLILEPHFMRWIYRQQFKAIKSLADEEKYLEAFDKIEAIKEYFPNDPEFNHLRGRVATSFPVKTAPPGAKVSFKDWDAVDTAWRCLGKSPIKNLFFPKGYYHWKLELEGYEPAEFGSGHWIVGIQSLTRELMPSGSTPTTGMVRVGFTTRALWLMNVHHGSFKIPSFWMDRHEVTNEEFEEFLAKGGYEQKAWWELAFVKEGKTIPWETARKAFRDKTNQPGPATWEGGTYPEGHAKYPVSGVSWYEAAAYARFKKMSLPTMHHWAAAAQAGASLYVVPKSNFQGSGPVPVGSRQTISPHGQFDMAGNVREWCVNATGESGEYRYLLGGSWKDESHAYVCPEPCSPWDRSEVNGMRCVVYPEGREAIPPALFAPVEPVPYRDYRSQSPCDDETFAGFEREYAYDREAQLHPIEEDIPTEAEAWRLQKVTLAAAYGTGEKLLLYLYLPKSPPELASGYQTVVLFPPYGRFGKLRTFLEEVKKYRRRFDYLVRSGRALVYPIYFGSFERSVTGARYPWRDLDPDAYQDVIVKWYKDLARCIDYLVAHRDDIDHERIAYYGYGRGGEIGPIVLALETRFKAAVFFCGGLPNYNPPAAVDPFNFAPRVLVPILMVNGAQDIAFPLPFSQRPLFEHLGTPQADKGHEVFPGFNKRSGGHTFRYDLTTAESNAPKAAVLNWLDRYLGEVNE